MGTTYTKLKNQARGMRAGDRPLRQFLDEEEFAPFQKHWTRIVNLANVAYYVAVGEWAQSEIAVAFYDRQMVLGFLTYRIASFDIPNHNMEMLVNELREFSATHLRSTGWEIVGLGSSLTASKFPQMVVGLSLINHGTTVDED